jgi:hypothetical protein
VRPPTEGNDKMSKRFAIVIGVAAAGVMAAGASADFRSVHDPRGDTRCFHDGGADKPCSDAMRHNADIVRATAGHEGTRLKHRIRVVGKLRSVHLLINTDSDTDCEWSLFVRRGERRPQRGDCPGLRGDDVIRRARLDFHFHSLAISFSKSSIGNPASYGWSVYTGLGGWRATAFDRVPERRDRYIEHSLG